MYRTRTLIISFICVSIVIGSVYAYLHAPKASDESLAKTPPFLRDSTFTIDGKKVTLSRGVEMIPITNSSSHITTRYFGNEATGDLNGDSLDDIAFLVTQDTGGSGLFYYAVVALQTSDGRYVYTNGFFVGDRIAPQSTEIRSDSRELHINFAERTPGEPMTTAPSIGAVLLLKVTSEGVLEGLMK